jgi:hypothetical protein
MLSRSCRVVVELCPLVALTTPNSRMLPNINGSPTAQDFTFTFSNLETMMWIMNYEVKQPRGSSLGIWKR